MGQSSGALAHTQLFTNLKPQILLTPDGTAKGYRRNLCWERESVKPTQCWRFGSLLSPEQARGFLKQLCR